MAATADNRPTTPVIALPPNPTGPDRYDTPLGRSVYRVCYTLGRWIWFGTFDVRTINPDGLKLDTGYVLACTHLSHLEPFLIGIYARRQVDWITRIEFYSSRFSTWFLQRFAAIPVRRQGVSASAIRTAIRRVNARRVVAIAPEGGVATGPAAAIRGGPIKRGAALIAYKTGRPVVPVVMLGTHVLQRVGPWLPFRRAKLWIAIGDPVMPPDRSVPRRQACERMTEQLSDEYRRLYSGLLDTFGLDDSMFP